MNATKVGPALAASEWKERRASRPGEDDGVHVVVAPYVEDRHRGLVVSAHYSNASVHDDLRHALAALCLHDQPFGFTWEDVDALREALSCSGTVSSPDDLPRAETTVDRIEALLPPRTDR